LQRVSVLVDEVEVQLYVLRWLLALARFLHRQALLQATERYLAGPKLDYINLEEALELSNGFYFASLSTLFFDLGAVRHLLGKEPSQRLLCLVDDRNWLEDVQSTIHYRE